MEVSREVGVCGRKSRDVCARVEKLSQGEGTMKVTDGGSASHNCT